MESSGGWRGCEEDNQYSNENDELDTLLLSVGSEVGVGVRRTIYSKKGRTKEKKISDPFSMSFNVLPQLLSFYPGEPAPTPSPDFCM